MTVFDALGRATHDGANIPRLALKRVVVHRENLLVIILSGNGVGYLVDIDKFVDENQKVASLTKEECQQFKIVVPVVIGNYYRNAEFLARLRLGGILATKPFQYLAF